MTSVHRVSCSLALLAAVAFEGTPANTQSSAASVRTDRTAYVAGQLVSIVGQDFAPGEIVTVQVTHADGTAEAGMGHEPAVVVAGSDGSVLATWTPNAGDVAGTQLVATVSGNISGSVTTEPFARMAAIETDKGDYQPGELALITGHGFAPDEPVELQVAHASGAQDGNGHAPFYATADGSGSVVAAWLVDPDDSLGSRFVLTARGLMSGVTGTTTFWDAGSISLSTLGTAYTQNFDTLASTGTSSTVPNGWAFVETGTNANTTYNTGTGSGNAGDTYSFGAASSAERALGTLLSGALSSTIGAQFTNNTGNTITSLAIAYTGEMWRLGQNTNPRAADRLDFQLSTNATALDTGSWVLYDSFLSPVVAGTVGALNGNVPPNRTDKAFTITGLNIPNGGSFWVRWSDSDLSPGADDGLAVDDFSLTPISNTTPIVTVTAPDNAASEAGPDTGTFRIARIGGSTSALTVNYTVGGSAENGTDYTPALTGTATIASGQSFVDVTITPADDPFFEGNETAIVTIVDTGDYDVGASASATVTIADNDAPDAAPSVSSTSPANGATNVPLDQNIAVTFTEPVNVGASWFTLACSASGTHAAAFLGGPTTFTINPDSDFASGESCTLTVMAAAITDQDGNDPPDNMSVNFMVGFTAAVLVPIHDIQGATHISPRNGQTVTTVPSIVTALRTRGSTRGFYIQDPNPDALDATSEGIFVFTGSTSAPATLVAVGDVVRVSGRVSEFRPSSDSLTITELVGPLNVSRLSTGNPLPAPIVIGIAGRIPPSAVIEDDATGDVETTGTFDPASDGIDFYESLEGMRVQLDNAVAVGPTSSFGSTSETINHEIPVVVDSGTNATIRTPRGGVVVRANDFNPERVILNDWIAGGPALPVVNVAASYPGAIVGLLDYSFGNYKLQVSSLPALVTGELELESTAAATTNQLAVATFNVENLAPGDSAAKFARLAGLIVDNLKAPDVLAIEEIQDNNGTTNDGVVSASDTWDKLIAAILTAGGPGYDYRQIDPVDDQDGGAPGGNIRQGFLFRTDRGLRFIDRPGGNSTTANAVVGSGSGTHLLYSPGRIAPASAAFNASRKPLAAEFMYRGHHLFVVANHFNSKGGDDPLFGRVQPPALGSEAQRVQQAQLTHDFLAGIVSADPAAEIVVMGDLNDFEFSNTVSTLKGSPSILEDLIDTLPPAERYSYVFEGNSQTLDHILVSHALFNAHAFDYDVVHVNSEFADQASDHDPQVVRITVNDPPTVSAGGPYSVNEGASMTLSATSVDLNGDVLTIAWDLDNDGSFETPGQNVTFGGLDGPGISTVRVKATDPAGLLATDTVSVTVLNVNPVVAAPITMPEPSLKGASVVASAAFDDPGPDAPFTCTVDYGDGSGPQAGTVAGHTCAGAAHVYATVGNFNVTIAVTDKDGGTGTHSASHAVVFAFSGFFQPVDNVPVLNLASAGRAIPVKFSLGGNQGMEIFAAGYPRSEEIPCESSMMVAGIEETVTAGNSSLAYDQGSARYHYVWKTDKAWAGTCRQLQVKFVDGTTQRANFDFSR